MSVVVKMQVLNGSMVGRTISDKRLYSLGGDGGGGYVDMWDCIEEKMIIHVCYL
jgi:hypothetical protein